MNDKTGTRPRILFFIGSLTGGGAERVTVSLSRYLVGLGYSVGVITMHDAERDFYTIPEGVDRVSMGLAGKNRGIQKLFANFQRLYTLRSILRQREADVVVGMMTTSAVLCIIATLGLHTKSVVSERNYPGLKPCRRPWALLRRLFYRFADAHVAQTQKAADWLRVNTGARTIHVIPNSIEWPIPSFPPVSVPEAILETKQRLILAVGTKPHQKGFDLLLEAFALVARDHPQWRLAIAGISNATSDGFSISEQSQKLGIGDKIVLLGRIGNLVDWYQRADIFVLSSRYEGFPNVLLEAMAAGCACIAFDCDTGPRDIIETDFDGYLVPAENTEALSEKLNELMGDDEKRALISASSRGVLDRYSTEKVMKAWLELLDNQVVY